MRGALVAAMILMGGGLPAAAAPAVPAAGAARDAAIEAALARHRSGAVAVAVIRGGTPAWSGVYGRQDARTPATRDTVFNVASLAKPFTAELILRLVDQGRIGLDEPISDSWVDPDLAADPRHRKLTPRIALSHQTGFPNWRPEDGKLAFGFEPGARFGYSGEGYEYLARLAERKTGQSFESLMQAYVLGPMRLQHTALSARPGLDRRTARPMSRDGVFGPLELPAPGEGSAADNLHVTIDDYAAFAARVMAGDGLKPELAAERLRIQTPSPGCPEPMPGCPDKVGMALGWMIMQFGEDPIAIHEGGDPGESSMVYFAPRTRDGVVVFVSGDGGTPLILDVLEVVDPNSRVLGAFRAVPAGG